MRKLLPIGSVIEINDKKEWYIIVGKMIRPSKETYYDYMCVNYPYGYIEGKEFNFFNDEDIKSIIFLGDINY